MEACEQASREVLKELKINPDWPHYIINIGRSIRRITTKCYNYKPDWEIWSGKRHMITVIGDKIIRPEVIT